MNLKIRKGKKSDLSNLFKLIKELAEFEKKTDEVTNTLKRMINEQKFFNFFVAEIDGHMIGFALYFFVYSTWKGKSLYLDDLYVMPKFQGQKIGSKLLRKIFELGKEKDCQRIRWQVLDYNINTIEIYKRMGAHISNECLNCDFYKKDIEKFLKK
ncbi:MAG: GNAT family N-acetyltransferase [Candidatus Gracilibacteria bacterium]|jgi:GNAT superfamily N-acetyltransferase